MTCAMDRLGLDVTGIEVSKVQVDYGNEMIGKNLLTATSIDDIIPTIKTTESSVLVFIYVLEHVTNLPEMLQAVKENKNIEYIFFSVPMFSLACVFEILFPDVYARQIGGGGAHTHLFTDNSLNWIFKQFDFSCVSTWRFGADIMDLYRAIVLNLEKNECHSNFISDISTFFQEETDAFQMIVDKFGFASDIHVLAKVH